VIEDRGAEDGGIQHHPGASSARAIERRRTFMSP
jgi:hypothetical protein